MVPHDRHHGCGYSDGTKKAHGNQPAYLSSVSEGEIKGWKVLTVLK